MNYERVTVRTDKGTRTIILRNPCEVPFLGSAALTGLRVNKEGVSVRDDGDVREIIDLELVTKRTAMRMNNHYGWLEEES